MGIKQRAIIEFLIKILVTIPEKCQLPVLSVYSPVKLEVGRIVAMDPTI